jgi:hypothetical protein
VLKFGLYQGDQMGEFPPRDFSLLLAVLGNIEEVAQIFALLLSLRNSCIFMLTKIVLATIWADLFTNETHKVTLFLYVRVARFGRIFACWPIDFFGYFFENSRSSLNIWATFFHGNSFVLFFFTKKGWATFWGTLSQAHLVTLLSTYILPRHYSNKSRGPPTCYRVTRLVEFSAIGRLLTLGSFWQIREIARIVGRLISAPKITF